LIVNELVNNALYHAFPIDHEIAQPEIHVLFKELDPGYELVIGDNGIGLPPELEWRSAKSLGLKLVNIWATRQLKGDIQVNLGPGTTFSIQFGHSQ
jgi:two-component sensor histidine kinase